MQEENYTIAAEGMAAWLQAAGLPNKTFLSVEPCRIRAIWLRVIAEAVARGRS